MAIPPVRHATCVVRYGHPNFFDGYLLETGAVFVIGYQVWKGNSEGLIANQLLHFRVFYE